MLRQLEHVDRQILSVCISYRLLCVRHVLLFKLLVIFEIKRQLIMGKNE